MAKPQIKTGYYKSGGKKFRQYAVSFNDSKNVVLVIDNYFGLLEDRQQNTFANMCYEVASTLRKNRTFVYTETHGMDSKDLLKMIKQINPSAIMFADATAFGQTSLDKSEYFSYVRDWKGIPTILTTPMNLWLDEKQYNKGEGNKALIGFNLKHLLAVTSGENPFDIDLELLGIKPKLIRDIDAFNTLMDRLETKDVICTDIEGKNLKVITNKIFTIQIGFWHKGKILSYVIPWEHRDHSWSKSDFRVVKRRLRQLFMREDLENVFHFGQFDIGHLCNELDMKMFGNKVYDIPSGEFCFDENTYVATDKGEASIVDIVDNPNKYLIKSFNHTSNSIEYKPIINAIKNNEPKMMYEVELETGDIIRVTEGHKIWCVNRNTYVEVQDLTEEDTLLLDDCN